MKDSPRNQFEFEARFASVAADETCGGEAEEGAGAAGRDQSAREWLLDRAHPHAHGGGRVATRLLRFVRETVEPGTTVNADGWPCYSLLVGQGCPHDVIVLHDPRLAGKLLPPVDRIASLFNR